MEEQIEHWQCSSCQTPLTYMEYNGKEVGHEHIFEFSRSRKELEVDVDGCIEENLDNRNIKMERLLCEECFNKVLMESATLRRLFEEEGGKIIFHK